MNFEQLQQYLLDKPEVTLDYPFGDDVLVFKVKKKMFALIGKNQDTMSMNLKCDPDEGAALRDVFPAIRAGYHMNKRHWITIDFDGTVPEGEIKRLIDNSFLLVVGNLTKQDQLSVNLHLPVQ
jgi:predicted DNA-binding protein (MmcQ/YjbR family)